MERERMNDGTPGPPEQEPERPRPPAYGQFAPGGQPPVPPPGRGPEPFDRRVTVAEAFGWAWSSFARSAGAWIGAMVVVLMIGTAATFLLTPGLRTVVENYDDPEAVLGMLQTGITVTDVFLSALLSAVEIVLAAVLAHGALAATRAGRATFGDFFALRNVSAVVVLGVVNALLTFLLAFVPVLGPLLRLVIGFFLAASLFFAVDAEQDAVTAMRSSVALVRRNLGIALLTVLVVLLVGFVGFLVFFVGGLVTVPVGALTAAYVYRRLTGGRVTPPG
jgi:uncharacterized membrane protein